MSVYTEQEVRELYMIAQRMSEQLQEFVRVAIEDSGNKNALRDVQALLREYKQLPFEQTMNNHHRAISLGDL